MDARLNNQSLLVGGAGLILQTAGFVFMGMIDPNAPPNQQAVTALIALGLLVSGSAALVGGLAMYARAKGQSGWWGLFGFLGLIGLIVLAVLPDRVQHSPHGTVTDGAAFTRPGEINTVAARWSMLCGIFGVVTFCVPLLGLGFPIGAVVLGHVARSRQRKHPESYGGKGMAIAGLIMGYLALAIALTMTVMIIYGIATSPHH